MSITKSYFGSTPDGKAVHAYTITNYSGVSATILSLGGILQKLIVPDRNGLSADIVCGFSTVDGYLTGGGYQGALVGRYANRISGGRFTLNGKTYQLACNEKGVTHLHGGDVGYNARIWNVEMRPEESRLVLSLFSPDGEENYPGNLSVRVTYTLGDDNALTIHYEADTDADTIFNPTSHVYYNLKGFDGGDVLDTELSLACDFYTPVNDLLIPEGAPVAVKGTDFDFTSSRPIGQAYDHNFLRRDTGYAKTAEAYDPSTGRTLTLYTDTPAIQLYTAGCMDGDVPFKKDIPQRPLHAFCLETQFSPDSPNRPDFASCVLKKGQHFSSTTSIVFGIRA